MDDLKKEIRRILLGYIDYRDNCIVAARESVKMRMLGTFNGTTMARLFGVSAVTRRYRFAEEEAPQEELSKKEKKKSRKNGDTKKKQNARKLYESADDAFQHIGRRVLLSSQPDRRAVFYGAILFNPSVLLLDLVEEEGAVDVTVVTARTLIARLNAAHAFWKWKRLISEELEQVEIPLPETEEPENADKSDEKAESAKPDKAATKEEKKAFKAKKKELAAAKKKARQKEKLEAKMAKLQAALSENSDEQTESSDENEE